MLKRNWWKALCAVMLMYTVIAGFLVHLPKIPNDPNLFQSARNIFFHVPMWMVMAVLLSASVYHSLQYLRKFDEQSDLKALEFAKVGVLFSILGMITGIEWSNTTWSSLSRKIILWTDDPKQICAAIEIFIYLAYFVLRNGIKDDEKRRRIGAVYNIFACAMMIPLLYVIPRFSNNSSHPGSEKGSPGLNPKDSSPAIRAVLYPAFIGWTMMGFWLTDIKIRLRRLSIQQESHVPSPTNTES